MPSRIVVSNFLEQSGEETLYFSPEQLLDNLTDLSVVTPLLPMGTRFYFQNDNHYTLVVEEKPQIRNILFRKKKYRLAFPYMIYIFEVYAPNQVYNTCDMRVFCAKKTLESLDDDLLVCTLFNINYTSYGRVCMGYASGDSLESLIKNKISEFWNSQFNMDIFFPEHWFGYLGLKFKYVFHPTRGWLFFAERSLRKWQRKSKKNVLYGLKRSMPKYGKSLRWVLEAISVKKRKDYRVFLSNLVDVLYRAPE